MLASALELRPSGITGAGGPAVRAGEARGPGALSPAALGELRGDAPRGLALAPPIRAPKPLPPLPPQVLLPGRRIATNPATAAAGERAGEAAPAVLPLHEDEEAEAAGDTPEPALQCEQLASAGAATCKGKLPRVVPLALMELTMAAVKHAAGEVLEATAALPVPATDTTRSALPILPDGRAAALLLTDTHCAVIDPHAHTRRGE